MIWFSPDKSGGFDLGAPDWSGSAEKASADEQVSDIVIGAPFTASPPTVGKAIPEPPPPPPEPPPPPPEPQPDPRVENNLKLLAASISELANQKKALEERDLAFCIALGFAVAEQLTCGTLEANPEKVMGIVKEALGMFDEDDKPVVRLHPDIIEAFQEFELLTSLNDIDGVTIKPDPAVSKMGCVVTANKKTVNAEVPARLDQLMTLFAMEQGGDA